MVEVDINLSQSLVMNCIQCQYTMGQPATTLRNETSVIWMGKKKCLIEMKVNVDICYGMEMNETNNWQFARSIGISDLDLWHSHLFATSWINFNNRNN